MQLYVDVKEDKLTIVSSLNNSRIVLVTEEEVINYAIALKTYKEKYLNIVIYIRHIPNDLFNKLVLGIDKNFGVVLRSLNFIMKRIVCLNANIKNIGYFYVKVKKNANSNDACSMIKYLAELPEIKTYCSIHQEIQ